MHRPSSSFSRLIAKAGRANVIDRLREARQAPTGDLSSDSIGTMAVSAPRQMERELSNGALVTSNGPIASAYDTALARLRDLHDALEGASRGAEYRSRLMH